MNKINQQVPGPLVAGWHGEFDACMTDGADVLHVAEWLKFASQGVATAQLARHAYTAFDKAGRELGVDATAFAQSLDIAALVRAARSLVDASLADNFMTHGRGLYEMGQLRAELAKLPQIGT